MSAVTPLGYEPQALSTTFARRWFAVFVRLLWKEFRVVSPFLLVVAMTMVGLGVLADWALRDQPGDAWQVFVMIVSVFPVLFALGCGGMSYAGEREDGTWDWLRRIAAPPSAVCAAKIVVGLTCGLGLAAVPWWPLAALAPLREMGWDENGESLLRLIVLLMSIATTLLISQIVSSLFKHVFVALIVSGIVLVPALFTVWVLCSAADAIGISEVELAFVIWIVALPGLILSEFSLADCWLKDVPPWRGGLIGILVNPGNCQRRLRSVLGDRQQPLAHLMSREWTLAKPWRWAFALTLFIPILTLIVPSWLGVRTTHYWQAALLNQWLLSMYDSPLLMLGSAMLGLVPVLFGVWAYHPDQCELRFRFLADRGISPPAIWLSKHLVRLPMLLVWVFAVTGLCEVTLWVSHQLYLPIFGVFGACLLFAVTSYAVGQLFGQLDRSPITSSFLAVVFAMLLTAWTHCLRLLDVSFVFDLFPIAILFAASWLRSSDWLLERTSWRARLRLTASLIVPFALLYGAVGWQRTSGVPRVVRQPLTANAARELATKWDQAERNGSQEYGPLDQIFRRSFSHFQQQLDGILQNPNTLAAVREVARPNTKPLDTEPLLTLRLQVDIVTNGWRESLGQDYVLGRLLKPEKKFHEAEIIVRHLHEAAFREACDRLIPLTERDDLVWPSGMTECIRIYNEPYLPPRIGLTLLVSADALADRQQWDEAFEHTLAALRLARQLSRTNEPQTENYAAGTLRDAALKKLLELAVKCRSADVVHRAIRSLADNKFRWPSRTESLAKSWSALRESNSRSVTVARTAYGLADVDLGGKSNLPEVLYRLFPWERERERRLADLYVARDLALCEAIVRVLNGEADRIRLIPFPANLPVEPTGIRWYANDRLFDATLPITQEPDINEMAQWLVVDQRFRSMPLRFELERRTLLLEMGLAAWHHERGSFPNTLSELIGPILDEMPLDPLTGKPFDLIATEAELVRRFPHSSKTAKPPLPFVVAPWAPSRCQLRVDSPDGRRDVWIEMAPHDSGESAAALFANQK